MVPIEEVKELTLENLKALAQRTIAAICVKSYYPQPLCQHAVKNLLSSEYIQHYSDLPGFMRVGLPYAQAYEDLAMSKAETVKIYFDESLKMIHHIRQAFHPYYSPIDNLRLDLDEIWPGGAHLKTVNQQKYFIGISRLIRTPEVNIPPHFDRYLAIYPKYDKKYSAQLTANIYLETPRQHGELKLWLEPLETISSDQAHKLAVCHEEKFKDIPKLILSPQQGDLIIFNAALLHAVSGNIEDSRISLGSFIGMNTTEEPLDFWS
jgi:hypothetical protein